MAPMIQSCACCWITVPQYGHRALAFTSSGAPQHGKQSENFLQGGILSPIFFYAGYPLSIIYFAPAYGKRDFPRKRTAAPPESSGGAALFDVLVRVPYIFPCLRRRERQSAIMAINSLFVGLPLIPETV